VVGGPPPAGAGGKTGPAIIILAAGIGRRYGGLKQIAPANSVTANWMRIGTIGEQVPAAAALSALESSALSARAPGCMKRRPYASTRRGA